jgi:hypothetical protein
VAAANVVVMVMTLEQPLPPPASHPGFTAGRPGTVRRSQPFHY